MYNIMIVKSQRDNYESMYQFLTTTVDGVTSILGIETKDALDKKVESMLNDGGYAKSDFIIVEVIDYTIDAKDYSDDEAEAEADTSDTTEEDNTTEDDSSGEETGEDTTEETTE